MAEPDPRSKLRELAAHYADRPESLGWFEDLYKLYREGQPVLPWARLRPGPWLVEWVERSAALPGPEACVIGCALGDDAMYLASKGLRVTAFDVAPTAVELARERYPESPVEWLVADLTALPELLTDRFDFVFEANTLQAIPPELRRRAFPATFRLLKSGGLMLLVARGRDEDETITSPPWPLTRAELAPPGDVATIESFEEIWDAEDPPVRRFRVEYRKRERADTMAGSHVHHA